MQASPSCRLQLCNNRSQEHFLACFSSKPSSLIDKVRDKCVKYRCTLRHSCLRRGRILGGGSVGMVGQPSPSCQRVQLTESSDLPTHLLSLQTQRGEKLGEENWRNAWEVKRQRGLTDQNQSSFGSIWHLAWGRAAARKEIG